MDDIDPRLEEVYRATTYRVFVPVGPPIDLRVGERSAELDLLLTKYNLSTWAFISACNPGSRPLPAAENDARHAKLLRTVKDFGWRSLQGVGIPAGADWQPEPSVIVLGVATEEVVAVARDFEQNAILAGRRGGEAELVYCA
jgi:hypothetical protein